MTYGRLAKTMVPAAVLLVGLALLLPACSGSKESSSSEQAVASADTTMAGGSPSIEITSPSADAMVPPGQVTVQVQVSNFHLVDKLGEQPQPGQGHIHYYLDVTPPTTPGEPAVVANADFAPSSQESHTFDDVQPGPHMLAVELVNNDHTPLQPAVVDSVHITVEKQMSGSDMGSGT
jgi:hypothetical protein